MLKQEIITQHPTGSERKSPQEMPKWAINTFWPQKVMLLSFQTQSMPLIQARMLFKDFYIGYESLAASYVGRFRMLINRVRQV